AHFRAPPRDPHRSRRSRRRIGKIKTPERRKSRACGGLPPIHGRVAGPRGRLPVNHSPFLSKTEPCLAACPRQSCATLLLLRSIPSTLHHYQFERRATAAAT